MGIDITAYSELEKTEYRLNNDYEITDTKRNIIEDLDFDYVEFYINPDFPGRANEIESNVIYKYKKYNDECHYGYIGYGILRNNLAKIAGYQKDSIVRFEGFTEETYCAECWDGREGPFSELINFSDCEGTIGASISKKLYNDFIKFENKIQNEDERFKRFYKNMKEVFKLASNNGAVKFH